MIVEPVASKHTRRTKSCSGALSPKVKYAAAKLSNHQKRGFFDYIYTAMAADINPFPVTPEKLSDCTRSLERTALTSARPRSDWWRVCCNAICEGDRVLLGLGPELPPRPTIRLRNAPAGTFPNLERGLSDACAAATRPRRNDFDLHDPVDKSTAAAMAHRMLIVATTLWQHGIVTREVELPELLTIQMQRNFLNIIDDTEGKDSR